MPQPPSTRVTDCPGPSLHSRSLKRVMVMLGAGVAARVGVETAVAASRARVWGVAALARAPRSLQ